MSVLELSFPILIAFSLGILVGVKIMDLIFTYTDENTDNFKDLLKNILNKKKYYE